MSTAENPHAGQGMVVLDIGGDIGALVVTTPPDMDGREIEICPAGHRGGPPDDGAGWWQGDWHSAHHHESHDHGSGPPDAPASHDHVHGPAWPHVGVLRRPGPTETYAAVYPGLRAGRYELWLRPDEPTALTAEVLPAEVTTVSWPAR